MWTYEFWFQFRHDSNKNRDRSLFFVQNCRSWAQSNNWPHLSIQMVILYLPFVLSSCVYFQLMTDIHTLYRIFSKFSHKNKSKISYALEDSLVPNNSISKVLITTLYNRIYPPLPSLWFEERDQTDMQRQIRNQIECPRIEPIYYCIADVSASKKVRTKVLQNCLRFLNPMY